MLGLLFRNGRAMHNCFTFIDESGNLSSEPYFALGMLLVEDVGSLYDAIRPYYDRAREFARDFQIGGPGQNRTDDARLFRPALYH